MSDLLSINVNEHTEKKGGLTYLSWAWAWAEVLKVDPRATWKVLTFGDPMGEVPFMRMPGDTAMVHTSVTINGLTRDCMLPVMDNRNNAVKNPDARKISDALMRCMVKAIAMHGLGLYIYAGEDLPQGEHTDPETGEISLVPVLQASIEQAKAGRVNNRLIAAEQASQVLSPAQMSALAKLAREVEAMHAKREFVEAFRAVERSQLDSEERAYLWGLLPSGIRNKMKAEREAALMGQAVERNTTTNGAAA